MSDWAVTVNLGGSWLSEACKSGMIAWTRRMLRDRAPALIFAQETFADWLRLCDDEGYKVVKGSIVVGRSTPRSCSGRIWSLSG